MCDYLKRILLVTCLVMLMTGVATSATFMVMEGGTAPYFTNLDTALWTAETYGPGPHTIEVYAGNYGDVGLVVPTNVVAIIGMDVGVVFTDPLTQTGMFLDVSGTTDLAISGITVKDYVWGITSQFSEFTGLHVFDCVFDNNGQDGVSNYDGGAFSIHGSNILIEDCEIMNGERGVRFGYKYWDAGHANTWVGTLPPPRSGQHHSSQLLHP